MELIQIDQVQTLIPEYENKPVYLHVETTNGAYANHFDQKEYNDGTFLRNIQVTLTHANLSSAVNEHHSDGPKLDNNGWVYVQGLTHYEVTENKELLLAGLNHEGQLAASLEISSKPFKE